MTTQNEEEPLTRRGIEVISLNIDEGKPLVFDVPLPPGDLVFAYCATEKGRVIAQRQPIRIVPRLCFDVEVDAPKSTRRFVLVPAGVRKEVEGTGEREWAGGWIGEPNARLRQVIVNPIDGMPLGIYEVPWEPATLADDEPLKADAPVDAESVTAILGKLRDLDASDAHSQK